VARAGTSGSPAVSNNNGLPAEQPFIASAVQIQRIVRGIATRKRVAKVFDNQRKNREKGKTHQAAEQEEKRKE
jgi:hypothetical protein